MREVQRVLKVLAVLVPMVLVGCAPPADEPSAGPATAAPASEAAGGPMIDLPKQVGPWERADSPKRITAATIFDYMNGGGELYLAYRFNHLDVLEYKAADASLGTILVEIYQMGSSDDAFGLLSTDWGGEPVALDPAGHPQTPFPEALYGAGLLRLRAGDLYARVLASLESPGSREQVLALGRAIANGRQGGAPPELLSQVPVPAGWSLRSDRLVFFRSHLVLNSAYFLASGDILGLGSDVEGVTTECRAGRADGRAARLIVVKYPSADRAAAALRTFRDAYLPETAKAAGDEGEGTAPIEEGWAAYRRNGAMLTLALDVATRDAARTLVEARGRGRAGL